MPQARSQVRGPEKSTRRKQALTVSQDELEQERVLNARIKLLHSILHRRRNAILAKLQRGARVEPGKFKLKALDGLEITVT